MKNPLIKKNELDNFQRQVKVGLENLSKEEIVRFAWRCAVRALPFWGAKGNFNFLEKKELQKYLHTDLSAIDVAAAAIYAVSVADTTYVTADARAADTARATNIARTADDAYAAAYARVTDISVKADDADAFYDAYAYAAAAAAAALAAATYARTATTYATSDARVYAYSAARAAVDAYASASTYIDGTDQLIFQQSILKDLQPAVPSEGGNCIEGYGSVLKNFIEALEKNDCGYWAKWYQSLFEKGLILNEEDEEEIKMRLNIPAEIRDQGAVSVGRYMEQLNKQGVENLYEARIVIVGEPGSGKTTLFRKFKDENIPVPDPDQKSTHGINIDNEVSFNHCTQKGQKIKTSVWDFGGQDIQSYLHQYFYSQDNLFILVCDDRKENSQFDYWFEMITRICNEGKIIVVRNLKDRESASQSFNATKYENRFPGLNLKCVDVDLKEKDDYRILRHTIEKMLSELRIVNDVVPQTWKPVREKILQLKYQNEPYISLSKFYEVCIEKGIQKEKYQNQCLDYLHRLGYALHYEDIQLVNTVFINPQWIAAGLYEVLKKDNYKLCNQGRFSKNDIHDVWRKKGYINPPDRNLFLNLLLKDRFDVCYPVEGTDNYLVPLLISHESNEPSEPAMQSYKYRFKFPFMPFGFFSRLIVRLYDKIWDDYVWLTGVWLIDENKCKARLEQFNDRNTGEEVIEVIIYGEKKKRKDLLSEIRTEVLKIKKVLFRNLIIEEQIPCLCVECKVQKDTSFHNKDKIENFLYNKNINTSQCDKSGEQISIYKLLDSAVDLNNNSEIESIEGIKGIVNYGNLSIGGNNNQYLDQSANNTTINIKNFQGNIELLKEEFDDEKMILLKSIDEDEYEVVYQQIEKAENAIQKIELLNKEGKPIPVKEKSRLSQFISNLTDENTTLGKCIKLLGNGVDFASKLVDLYSRLPIN